MADPTNPNPPSPSPPPTPDPAPEKPKLDPFVQSLVTGFDKILEPEPPKPEEDVNAPMSNVTLGEAAERAQTAAKEAAEKAAANPPAPAPQPTPPEPPAPAAEPPKPALKVRKIEPPPPAQIAPAPPPPAPPPDPEKNGKVDEEYFKTLTLEEQDEIQLAQFADTKAKPGILAQTIEYFKKVDKFIEEHPDLTPESEEFTNFTKANKPQWSNSERRKIERQMISEEAARAAEEKFAPAMQETSRKVLELETRPYIEQSVAEVEEAIQQKREGTDLVPVEKEVVAAIREKGYDAALEEFPVEAPIVQGTLNATRAWLELSRGLVPFDPNNGTHQWLAGFIAQEGHNIANGPKELRVDKTGRTFLPFNQMLELQRTKPEEAAKHWTFDEGMVKEMLANRAVLQVNHEIKRLEKSGFKREARKVSGNPGNSTATTAPTAPPVDATQTGSTRAAARSMPGASDGGETLTEAQKFIETLVPGAGRALGAK